MQRKNTVWKWIVDRGYYIALGICVVSVALSGVLFIRSLKPAKTKAPEESDPQQVIMPTLPDTRLTNRPKDDDEIPAAVVETVPKPGRNVKDPEREAPAVSEAPVPSDAPTVSEAPSVPTRPVAVSPLEGDVSQPYSMDKLAYNTTTKDWRTHAGIDIAAPEGSTVRAAAEGRVLGVYEDALLGQTVTIQHAGGFVTHYSNLAPEVSVFVGDVVEAGQTIGTVGRTALLEIGSDSHLHFAVYKNNVPQDPEAFLNP